MSIINFKLLNKVILKSKNLTKTYNGRTVANKVNIEIRPGEIIGLLGPNGAGKSTTIKMLTGQITPTSGEIFLDGNKVNTIRKDLSGIFGIMPQEIIIWDELTIEENLYYAARIQKMNPNSIKKRIELLVEGLQLQRELKTLGRNLSGGYKRRLNLAISIIHDPQIIFLDEPSPGVDAHTRRFLWRFIKDLKAQGKSILLTDHYLEEAEKLSDYVVIIDNGEVIAEGTVKQLKEQFGEGVSIRLSILEENIDKSIDNFKAKFNEKETTISWTEETITLVDKRGMTALEEINRVAKQFFEVSSISINEPTLEDVFIILTGKEIRE